MATTRWKLNRAKGLIDEPATQTSSYLSAGRVARSHLNFGARLTEHHTGSVSSGLPACLVAMDMEPVWSGHGHCWPAASSPRKSESSRPQSEGVCDRISGRHNGDAIGFFSTLSTYVTLSSWTGFQCASRRRVFTRPCSRTIDTSIIISPRISSNWSCQCPRQSQSQSQDIDIGLVAS